MSVSLEASPRISIVVPVYNEEESLGELFGELSEVLEESEVSFEVIFVDDGSQDNSRVILRNLAQGDKRVRVVCFTRNFGQSAALAAGFRKAQGGIVVTMDGDLQIDPRDIPRLLEKISLFHVVYGWRANRQDPLQKRLSSRFANGIRNWLTAENIADVGCPLRAFRRECLESFFYFDGMHRFFPTLLKMEGYTVTELKVNHRPRKYGSTKYGIRNRAVRGFIDLLAVRWMKRRRLRYEVEEVING